MQRFFPVLILGLLGTGAVQAQGLLVPTQQGVPPLALSGHEVKIGSELGRSKVTLRLDGHLIHVIRDGVLADFVQHIVGRAPARPLPAGASRRQSPGHVEGAKTRRSAVGGGDAGYRDPEDDG